MELKEIAESLCKTQVPRLPPNSAQPDTAYLSWKKTRSLFSREDQTGRGSPDCAELRAEFPSKTWNISEYVSTELHSSLLSLTSKNPGGQPFALETGNNLISPRRKNLLILKIYKR